jgi:uncharacterized protein
MKNYNKIVFFFVLLFFINCKKEIKDIETINAEIQELEIAFIKEGTLNLSNDGKIIKTLEIEIASDSYERENGLMNRSEMLENRGMLFVFDEPKIQNFWMKNTRIPLDIIYINENKKVINIAKNTIPQSENGTPPSTSPAKYVLEINGGMSNKWGIKEGITQINWQEINNK